MSYPIIKAVIISAYSDIENIERRWIVVLLTSLPLNLQDLTITTIKNSATRTADESGLRTGTLSTASSSKLLTHLQQEVTVRQRVEELRESEKKLAQFLEAVPVGCLLLMPMANPTTLIRLHNRYLARESNRSHSRSIKRKSSLSGGDGAVVPHWAATHYPSIGWWKCHHRWYWDSPSRQCYPLEVSANFFDDKGRIIYAIAAFQNISQRKGRSRADQFTKELALKMLLLQAKMH